MDTKIKRTAFSLKNQRQKYNKLNELNWYLLNFLKIYFCFSFSANHKKYGIIIHRQRLIFVDKKIFLVKK